MGGFELQWKLAVPPSQHPEAAITSWASMGGRKPIAFLTDDRGMVVSVDTDTGLDYWQRTFDGDAPPTSDCAAGLSSGAVRNMALLPATSGATRGGGFGPAVRPPFHGVVGEPGEGVARELMGQLKTAPPPSTGPSTSPPPAGSPPPAVARGNDVPAPSAGRMTDASSGRGMAAAARGGRGGPQGLYVVAPDGVLRILGENSGLDVQKPIPFVPGGSRPTGLSIVDGTAYVTTARQCGATVTGVQAMPLSGESHPVVSWESEGRPIGLPAFGTDGTVYVSVGGAATRANGGSANALVALEPRTLRLKDWYSPKSGEVASGPVIIRQNERQLIAIATADGHVHVLESASLGGADHQTAAFISVGAESGRPRGLASFTDPAGTPHILLSLERSGGPGNVMAFALTDGHALEQKWASRELVAPAAPVVVSDVIFALSRGRVGGPGAVLHVLDPRTGQSIWNSQSVIASAAQDLLLVGDSQVYVVTVDREMYAFGFAMDRAIK